MKLIDFTYDERFNELRKKMNASWITINISSWSSVDVDNLLRKLNSYEGIEVELDDIVFANDGTFEYKGQKVLVYIRDQYRDPDKPEMNYKFHIANCETMKRAFQSGREERYVVSTRTDGRFLVNVRNLKTGEILERNKIKELKVCKNCLLELGYNGYYSHKTGKRIYEMFRLTDFFNKYRTAPISLIPKNTDTSLPSKKI